VSIRPLQLASIIHRAVQSVVSEGLSDPRLSDVMATVTGVKVSKDLRSATVLVSIMPEKAQSRAMHALNDASRFIRRVASERVSIQRMPDLLFRLDTSIKKQAEILAALDEVERERREAGGGSETAPEPTESIPTPNDGDHP
jgi:ribosome-binding factor A